MTRSIPCPECDSAIEVGSIAVTTTTCPSCESRVVVNGQAAEARNKMALLAQLPSCLAVGWPAECQGKLLMVHGRVQYRYEAGIWDEWFVKFTDHTHGWITQDEGRYILQTEVRDVDVDIEAIKKMNAGDVVTIGDHDMHIKEIGFATMVGMQGELPFHVDPDEIMHYIELTDLDRMVSIEIFRDGSHLIFDGQYLKAGELKPERNDDRFTVSPFKKIYSPPVFDDVNHPVKFADEDVKPKLVKCPNCKRRTKQISSKAAVIVCSNCRTGIDVSRPNYRRKLFKNDNQIIDIAINVGDPCTLNGKNYVVGGRILYRQKAYDGVYHWTACQLMPTDHGEPLFLENEDDHWTLFRPPNSTISHSPKTLSAASTIRCEDETFTSAETGRCEIVAVDGELTWIARVGEELNYLDAVKVPRVLAAEWDKDEIEWSLGTYIDRLDVAEAFDQPVSNFPKPRHYVHHQPFRSTINHKLCFWVAAVVAAFMFLMGYSASRVAGEKLFSDTVSPTEYLSGEGYLSEPIAIPQGEHACKFFARSSGLNNQWIDMSFLFVDAEQRVLLDEDTIVERYMGSGWTEGSGTNYKLVRLRGPRSYRINLFAEAGSWSQAGGDVTTRSGHPLYIELRRGVRPARLWLFGGVLACIYPFLRLLRWMLFSSAKADWLTEDDED